MTNECTQERIAIIADGCKVGQSVAEKLHAEQIRINPFADVSDRLKSALQNARLRKYKPRHDGKLLASGA